MRRVRGRWAGAAAALAVVASGVTPAGPAGAAGSGVPGARQELSFQDPAIDESSGLVVRGRDVLTVNDSEGEPVVHVVDAATGTTVGRTTYAPAAVDVEALAAGRDGEVWVGDIGDNARARPEISLYRLPSVERGDRTVAAERFDLAYPDGPRDAEALLVDPRSGQVFVVSKGTFGGEVFAAPRPLRPGATNRLRPVGTTGGLVTDGAFLPDGRSVVLRDYWDGYVLDPGTWAERGSFPLPEQQQGEGIAPWPTTGGAAPGTRVLVSSEGVGTPLWSVPVPARLVATASDREEDAAGQGGGGASEADEQSGPQGTRIDDDEPATPVVPVGPAIAAGAVLVAVGLGGAWLLRRRSRR